MLLGDVYDSQLAQMLTGCLEGGDIQSNAHFQGGIRLQCQQAWHLPQQLHRPWIVHRGGGVPVCGKLGGR